MDEQQLHAAKQTLFEEWMEDDHVLVHLDSRLEDVVVPTNLQQNPALTLKLSYRFQGATTVTPQGITAYLRFNGDYFQVSVPWHSLWGMTSASGTQKIWPESVPADVMRTYLVSRLKELTGAEKPEIPEDQVPPTESHTPGLKVAASHEPADEKRPQRLHRPFLKRIK